MVNHKITTLLCLLVGGFHVVTAAPHNKHQGVEAARSNLNDRDIHIAEKVLSMPTSDQDDKIQVSKKVSSSLNSIHIDLEFGATCARVGEKCEQDSDCCPNWTACTGNYCRKL